MSTEAVDRAGLRTRVAARLSMPVLVALVVADLFFVAASVWHLIGADSAADRAGRWILETDGGHAEQFGYAQQAAIALLLLTLAVLVRRGVFVAWATFYLAALADDSWRLHETKGAWLADRLAAHLWFPDGLFGLRANDLGEILVWGLLAVVPLAAAVLLHRRADRATRRVSLGVGLLLAAYVFVGGVVDQLHVLVMDTPIGDAVGTIEDGGELVVLSGTVAYAVARVAAALRSLRTEDEAALDRPAEVGTGSSPAS